MKGISTKRGESIITILAAPAEPTLKKSGERYSIGYNLLDTLSKEFGVKFHAITNTADILTQESLKNVQIYEVGMNIDSLFKRKFILKYNYFKLAKKIIKENKVSAIHQMGTFAYRTGFSFLSFLGITKDYPFIIGPAEAPHLILEDDWSLGTGREYGLIKVEAYIGRHLFKLMTFPFFKKTINDCDILIAVNEETKELFSKYISSKKIRIIPLGINSNDLPFSLPPNNHEILTVGAHVKRKGFDYLIKAMPKILKEYPDAKLHMPSDGPRKHILEALTKELGVESNLIFHGYVSREKLFDIYKNCRVFCHPSISEGFCHVTLEAMATGRPVVSTDNFGSKMVEHGKTGFLVPPADSDAIADAILRVFDNYELTCKMGIEARKKIEEEYDWYKVAEKYHDVYQEVMD